MKTKKSATESNSSLPDSEAKELSNENSEDIVIPPEGIYLSHRFLSPWSSNKLRIAVGHHTEPKAIKKIIDIDKITLQCSKRAISKGVYIGINSLNRFPSFLSGLKLAINSCLLRNEKGEVDTEVFLIINRLHVFFAYLIQNGIYCLEDCTPEVTQKLLIELVKRPPRDIMETDFHLLKLSIDLKKDIRKARLLMRKNGQFAAIDSDLLSQYIGFFIAPVDIPNWFKQSIGKLLNERRPINMTTTTEKTSRSYMKSMMQAINLLALHPKPLDSLAFIPYPNINKTLIDIFSNSRHQTPNISPEQYSALFSTLLVWVLDYTPHLLNILSILRDYLEVGDEKDALMAIIRQHSTLVDEGKLPEPKITQLNNPSSPDSLQYLVRVAITAAGYLVSFNHARRAKEIFGEGKPYGLYFGCLTRNPNIDFNYSIDVYLQKGPQNYQTLPANSLVASSIEFLEKHFNLTRDLGLPEVEYKNPTTSGRRMHLCTVRNFTIAGFKRAKRLYISPRDYLIPLLIESGINPDDWSERQTPMRRAWLTLFIRRYDLPEWPAGQRSLGQLDLNSTITYQTDTSTRQVGDSVAEFHGRETLAKDGASMIDGLAMAKKEYLQEGVQRLFKGTFTGGAFSSVILKLVKQLSVNADFNKLTIERRAKKVADKLAERGFLPDPMSHIVCMAGTATETRASANCSRQGMPHKEDASPQKCNGCINGWSNDNYLREVIAERDRCLASANDINLSSSERSSMLAVATQLSEIIEAQLALSAETKIAIDKVVSSWNLSGPLGNFK